ncbi:MAG: Gfo/Idh/MocA family oxidoreductase [Planctomycetales bacterium]
MEQQPNKSRRDFLKQSGMLTAGVGALAALAPMPLAYAASDETIKVGLIGCGGRGTGAASQALSTAGPVKLVAMGDAFADHLQESLKNLTKKFEDRPERVAVAPDRQFVGFDAYEKVIASDVDLVILATPPHFRPRHFKAAVAANKHVFFEKPIAVDGAGVRTVLEVTEEARKKKLSVVCGLQRHHEQAYLDSIKRIHDGAIGQILAARVYWNMGSLWMKPRQTNWSDMEWQLRNWLYFTWLSGDHINEQHVHNLDVANWAKQAHPVRCFGMGGRQVRTEPAYGQIFDHHDVHYEYEDGSWIFSQCRQIPGCLNDVSEHFIGTKGFADLGGRKFEIRPHGKDGESWRYKGGKEDPYQTEHDDLFASVRKGDALNEGKWVAESTLTAIMGRMATYSGKEVTWEQALNSNLILGPEKYEWGSLPVDPVAVPGQTVV